MYQISAFLPLVSGRVQTMVITCTFSQLCTAADFPSEEAFGGCVRVCVCVWGGGQRVGSSLLPGCVPSQALEMSSFSDVTYWHLLAPWITGVLPNPSYIPEPGTHPDYSGALCCLFSTLMLYTGSPLFLVLAVSQTLASDAS